MNVFDLIKLDLHRYTGEQGKFLSTYLKYEGFKFSVWLRICHALHDNKILKYTVFVFAKGIYKHYKYKYGYDIPYNIEIGPGLLIYHIGGVVFSAKKAGKNLTISQNTTVGMKIHNGNKEYPVIGDNVYMAPGSAIIGGIKIGNGVAVGTNAVLLDNVEDNSVVVGIPGKVVSYNGSSEYINNPV